MVSTPDRLLLTVSEKERPQRIDLYLITKGVRFSRSRLQRLISQGLITINDRSIKPSTKVHPGDHIEVAVPPPTPIEARPEPIPLNILHEDESLLVINKPAGMVVHPAPGHHQGTLVNALLHYLKAPSGGEYPGGRERPGIVHRLDKDTSGLLVVAKTDEAHRALSQQFKSHTVRKTYRALVLGDLTRGKGRIELAIGRDIWERKKFSQRTKRPKEAITTYKILERFGQATLLEAYPETGRTHQIRVHMASLNHPVVGDHVYGGKKAAVLTIATEEIRIPRQMLHARSLGFLHPVTGKDLTFTSPIPPDMEEVLEALRTLKNSFSKLLKKASLPPDCHSDPE